MTIASGVEKKVILAPQATKGTVADASLATAQYLRRVTSSLDLTKETYQSNEVNNSRQVLDFRHGVQSVDGTINGELSVGTYGKMMAAILRKNFVAGVSDAANTNVAIDASAKTLTRDDASGSWLEDGFKVGDIIRCTGFTATGNNSVNFMITAVTATVITFIVLNDKTLTTEAKGQAVTTSVIGKKSWIPATGHTEDWFTFEHYYSDLDISEVYYDCKVSSMALKLPPTGIATIDVGIMGLNHNFLATGASPYFSAVLAASTGGVLAGVNGAVIVEGAKVALITGLDFNIAGNLSSEPVVGSNVKPDVFDGRVIVTGNMSVFFDGPTFRDYFANETEVSISAVFTASNDDAASFIAFTMPRVKVGGSQKDDGEKGLIQTVPFTALFDTSAGADTGATATNSLATTISVQDSSL